MAVGRKSPERRTVPRHPAEHGGNGLPTEADSDEMKEETKMMNNMMIRNMSNMMAEDSGLFELRNPEFSGLRATSWVSRLIRRMRRH